MCIRDRLLDAGLCVTVNSDDPAYFGGYVNDNYVQTFAATGLDARQAWQLAANSFEASFVEPEVRQGYVAQLDTYFRQFAESSAAQAQP